MENFTWFENLVLAVILPTIFHFNRIINSQKAMDIKRITAEGLYEV